MSTLATIDELPADYRAALESQFLTPLWPHLRNLLPHGRPESLTRPHHWPYAAVRPLVLEAGSLTPIEKAERRVLVLSDPGRGSGAMQMSATIYCGLQLLLPGERAPTHRHTPSAARIIIEGKGGYTVVNGERCAMEPGDLILTPGGQWHDHGHDGTDPVIWLDALDLPLFGALEASYVEDAPLQNTRGRPDASEVEYRAAGLAPARDRSAAASRPRYPQTRYPWAKTREALTAMLAYRGGAGIAELDYINPETGDDCLPTLGFAAMAFAAEHKVEPVPCSANAMFHVIEGSGSSTIDGHRFDWSQGDSFSAPPFASIRHESQETAFLIRIHDRPLQTKLGYYEERPVR